MVLGRSKLYLDTVRKPYSREQLISKLSTFHFARVSPGHRRKDMQIWSPPNRSWLPLSRTLQPAPHVPHASYRLLNVETVAASVCVSLSNISNNPCWRLMSHSRSDLEAVLSL